MKKSKLPKQALIILSIALVLVISTVMWSSADDQHVISIL